MTYFTTKTVLRNLEEKLQELADDGHTIISVVNGDGFLVIISTKA
jgi:hypothetical protein